MSASNIYPSLLSLFPSSVWGQGGCQNHFLFPLNGKAGIIRGKKVWTLAITTDEKWDIF
jgi:hypothetical protein